MIPTDLYTAEGADSARQSAKDKSAPDPTPEQATAAIEANTLISEDKETAEEHFKQKVLLSCSLPTEDKKEDTNGNQS